MVWCIFSFVSCLYHPQASMFGYSSGINFACSKREFVPYTGCTKKMYHSGLHLISVLKVGFYFFAYVLESEFLACFNWTPKQCWFWLLIALNTHKTQAQIFFAANLSEAWTVTSLPQVSENDGNIIRINFFSGDVFFPFMEGLRVWLLLREASLRTSIVFNLMGMLECWSGHPQGCRLSSFSLQLATLCFKREA